MALIKWVLVAIFPEEKRPEHEKRLIMVEPYLHFPNIIMA
jgi:hypothetical protein